MPSTIFLKAAGLYTADNPLNLPEGSLLQANNVVIKNDGIIEQRRGYKLYGESFGTSTDRAKQLTTYKNRIIRHYNDVLQYDKELSDESFGTFAGSYTEVEPGLRIKNIEFNKNFYFTTNAGIKKISAKTANDFTDESGYITQAGGIKALDLNASLDITPFSQIGFLPVDSTIAYRVVWGNKDANNNLVLGTPSNRAEVYNSLQTMLVRDLLQILNALDNLQNASGTSLINDYNYVSTLGIPLNSTAATIRDNSISLASKLDNDIVYPLATTFRRRVTTTTGLIVFASDISTYVQIGDKVIGSSFGLAEFNNNVYTVTSITTTNVANDTLNFTAATAFSGTDGATNVADVTGVVNSYNYRSITQPTEPSVPATNSQLVTIQLYLQNIISRLQTELPGVISSDGATRFIDPLDITTTANVRLEITIPEEVTTNWFYQVYRSTIKQAVLTDVISDLVADDEMRLVIENFPTQEQIDARYLTVVDETPDEFFTGGANLYTNEISGEGILQANDVPPLSHDINTFKNFTFYSNTKTKHRKSLFLLGVSNILTSYDNGEQPRLQVTNSTLANQYYFIKGSQQITTVNCGSIASTTDGGYFIINSANNVRKYYVWFDNDGSGTPDPAPADRIDIYVGLNGITTANDIASKLKNVMSVYADDFSTSVLGSVVTITNVDEGYSDDAEIVTGLAPPWNISVTSGQGERIAKKVQTITTVPDVVQSLAGKYFLLNSAQNRTLYYVWFSVSGSGADPMVANRIGIQIPIVTNDTAAVVATALRAGLNELSSEFVATGTGSDVIVTNHDNGRTDDAVDVDTTFTITQNIEGALDILLSNLVSPSLAVEQTSKSLIKIINRNIDEATYVYNLSGTQDLPGNMLFEARLFTDDPFYITGNREGVGVSFNPDISPQLKSNGTALLATTNVASEVEFDTGPDAHGLVNGDEIIVLNGGSGADAEPFLPGIYLVSVTSATTFTIPKTTVTTGVSTFIKKELAEISDNEVRPNRIYYSKVQQPEAVPIVNFFDIGPQDKAILRIFPLRDSLFVFKEEGLYRVSGELAPFSQSLFDSSCIIKAPDSLGLANNLIFLWTSQGIGSLSEAGFSILTRGIDDRILPLASDNYPNFNTLTWGVGYDSDNSYIVYTVQSPDDEVATIGYYYHTITGTWTNFNKTATCGVVKFDNDKMYLGAGDENRLEIEKKTFSRLDYSDRELDSQLNSGNYMNNGLNLKLDSIEDMEVGDVVVQTQTVNIEQFNTLLKKLDADTGVDDDDYYSTLGLVGGVNLRSKLLDLAAKLDADLGISDTDYSAKIASQSGTITANDKGSPTVVTTAAPHGLLTNRVIEINGSNSTPSIDGIYTVTVLNATQFTIDVNVISPGTTGTFNTLDQTFDDIRACFNIIVLKLNGDPGVFFNNYMISENDTVQESIINSINILTLTLTVNLALPYVVGPLVIHKAIASGVTYAPNTMGDPLSQKHVGETTMMFKNKAFTRAVLSISTDLLPEYKEIPFTGDGNGIFGHKSFGTGFFGGDSHPIPFRTYVPRQCQRCRYISIKFTHKIARETYQIHGVTLTLADTKSTRAYR